LTDSTGARRFLPVQVLACDSLHTIDMQQLWAQVWHCYLEGWQWWCSGELEELLHERHERHSETNPTLEKVARVFNVERTEKGIEHKHYTATDILIQAGFREPSQQQAKYVNEYLKKCGFTQLQWGGLRGFWLEKWPFEP
jgi:predicted P-loop ATPase